MRNLGVNWTHSDEIWYVVGQLTLRFTQPLVNSYVCVYANATAYPFYAYLFTYARSSPKRRLTSSVGQSASSPRCVTVTIKVERLNFEIMYLFLISVCFPGVLWRMMNMSFTKSLLFWDVAQTYAPYFQSYSQQPHMPASY